jgi:hypothetical protein
MYFIYIRLATNYFIVLFDLNFLNIQLRYKLMKSKLLIIIKNSKNFQSYFLAELFESYSRSKLNL